VAASSPPCPKVISHQNIDSPLSNYLSAFATSRSSQIIVLEEISMTRTTYGSPTMMAVVAVVAMANVATSPTEVSVCAGVYAVPFTVTL
jgi:hypothetical protein